MSKETEKKPLSHRAPTPDQSRQSRVWVRWHRKMVRISHPPNPLRQASSLLPQAA